VEGITVDGGGGLRIGAREEKVRDGVLVLRLTVVGTYSLFMASGQTFHAIVLGIYSPCRSSSDSG
jgi:hypothetical protein